MPHGANFDGNVTDPRSTLEARWAEAAKGDVEVKILWEVGRTWLDRGVLHET